MKSYIHTVDISIFSINHVIVRPTKIMNNADKNLAHLLKTKCLKHFLIKASLLDQYSSKTIFLERFQQFLTLKNDFENQNL